MCMSAIDFSSVSAMKSDERKIFVTSNKNKYTLENLKNKLQRLK